MKREKETAGAKGFRLGARADAVYDERMVDDLKEKKRKVEDND